MGPSSELVFMGNDVSTGDRFNTVEVVRSLGFHMADVHYAAQCAACYENMPHRP